MVIKSQRGQTVVEYILLLAVSVTLVMTFLKSDAFRRFFGDQGQLGVMIKAETEFAYRHAFLRNNQGNIPSNNRQGSAHPSYFNAEASDTRFFRGEERYP